MIKIKLTHTVAMDGDKDGIGLFMLKSDQKVWIPANAVHQVLRGLITYNQKFYRKHDKQKTV